MSRLHTSRRTSATRAGLAGVAAAAALAGALLPAASPSSAHDEGPADPGTTTVTAGEVRHQLGTLRREHRQYLRPEAALADGWFPTPECAALPDGSAAMGVHYINPSRLQGPLDATKPPILLYAPQSDGSLRLAGVEWMVPDADGDLGTDEDRPSLFGRGFDGPMPGHDPTMPTHYDLHAWVFTPNPDGMFAPFNPNVTC